jgi:hypothetical protein
MAYNYVSLEQALGRIQQVSRCVAPENEAGVLNYIQFVAIEALTEAKQPITPYTEVGSPFPPCPMCPP